MTKKRRLALITLLLLPFTAFSQEPPRWITQQRLVFPPELYVIGVGEGRSREEAEERAVVQISLFFQTSVNDSRKLLYDYNNAIAGGGETVAFSQATHITSTVDFFGVAFAESYTDKKRIVHALAYIDREEALRVYDARIQRIALMLADILERHEQSPNPFASLKKLRGAKSMAELAAGYADMAVLLDSGTAARYAFVHALAARLDRAIETNQKQLTVHVFIDDERAKSLAVKTAEMLRREGFVIVETGGEYTAAIHIELNEGASKNYRTVQPGLDITVESQSGETLVRYQKEYAVFRHLTGEEALDRAFRNIEQNLSGEFAAQLRRSVE